MDPPAKSNETNRDASSKAEVKPDEMEAERSVSARMNE